MIVHSEQLRLREAHGDPDDIISATLYAFNDDTLTGQPSVSVSFGDPGIGQFQFQLAPQAARTLGVKLMTFADIADGKAEAPSGDPTLDAPALTDADELEDNGLDALTESDALALIGRVA